MKRFLKPVKSNFPDYVTVSHRKVKWARIQVRPTGDVLMVVPQRLSAAKVFAFYQDKQHWIEGKRDQALARQAASSLGVADDELLLFGEAFHFHRDDTDKRHAQLDHDQKIVSYAKNLLEKDQQRSWYRDFAKQYLSLRIAQLAEQHGFEFNRLFIREQKTRWGSCSSRGNISLNWKLIKAPVSVSDYVILHELVHTEIMNHSASFWLRVEALVPDFKEAKLWLRTHGCQL